MLAAVTRDQLYQLFRGSQLLYEVKSGLVVRVYAVERAITMQLATRMTEEELMSLTRSAVRVEHIKA